MKPEEILFLQETQFEMDSRTKFRQTMRKKLDSSPCFRAVFSVLLVFLCFSGCDGGREGTATTSLDPPAEADPPGDIAAFPFIDHVDQANITGGRILFNELFTLGDELFEAEFNTLDGVGIQRLPDGTEFLSRFSRIPPGGGRFTGPNGQACVGCHNTPLPTSAGTVSSNVVQDPSLSGVSPFNTRNPTHLFGSGVLQPLAEEITEALHAIRDEATAAAASGGPPEARALTSKGIAYGTIRAVQDVNGVITFDLSDVEGVDLDLVVRPYGWKGNVATLRAFSRSAAMNELGMEPAELVAKDPLGRTDPDGDGVEEEFSVGDVTALTIYIAAQSVPKDIGNLVGQGLEPPPTQEVALAMARGRQLFLTIGCATCHIPELRLDDPVFEEPTLRGRGSYFDSDIDPNATFLDSTFPFRFHLVQEGDFPRLEPHPAGGARAQIFGDLKRHNMGIHLADAQSTPVSDGRGEPLMIGGSPVEVPPAVFLTAELWGVGNTGPWLHDGRASSLEEAILLHGVDNPPPPGDPDRSEAQEARDAFAQLSTDDRVAVVQFLKSLILFALEEEEE